MQLSKALLPEPRRTASAQQSVRTSSNRSLAEDELRQPDPRSSRLEVASSSGGERTNSAGQATVEVSCANGTANADNFETALANAPSGFLKARIEKLRATIPDPNVWRVYATTLALGVAYGMAISLIAIFLDTRGYNKTDIGQLAAFFASGIVAFSLPVGWLLRRVSPRTLLALSLLGYAATVSSFPYLNSFWSLSLVRFLDGAFSVGIWVSSETLLLSRSNQANKGFVTSLYAVAMAIGYVIGPFAARLCAALMPVAIVFVVAGGIALAAALFVWTKLEPSATHHAAAPSRQPETATEALNAGVEREASLPAFLLFWRIKTSCFASFSYGYFQAAVVLFLPLYLMESKGIPKEQTIVIPAFFAAGMLLFSNYAGQLGDRYGHLKLMRVLASIGFVMVLGFMFLNSYAVMALAVFIAGASLASISPLSLALQGVVSPTRDYSRATAMYNAFYAGGMLLGPPISSVLFDQHGGEAMLLHLAGLWLMFVFFSLAYRRDDPLARDGRPLPQT